MLVFKSEADSEPQEVITLILQGSGWYCEQGTQNQQEWLCSTYVAEDLPQARAFAKSKGIKPKLLEYHDKDTKSRPGLRVIKKK